MRRTPLKRRRPRPKRADEGARALWREEGQRQRVCAVTGRSSGYNGPGKEGQPYQLHHVIYEQEVRRLGGDVWDARNCLRVATFVHKRHHSRQKPIPLRCLLDQNIDFAFELMGTAAYVYLTRHYEGHDERVELALAELEAE